MVDQSFDFAGLQEPEDTPEESKSLGLTRVTESYYGVEP